MHGNDGGARAVKTLSIVIPTCGNSGRLRSCLASLAGQGVGPFEIVLVSSATQELRDLLSEWPATRLVACPDPFSFSQAVNRGIASTSGEWVLVLNDDVVLEPTFLERLVPEVPADVSIGMVCGKLLSADGGHIDSTGQFVSRARTARERGHGEPDRGQYDVAGDVFSVPGAAALYRRRMLEALAIGGQYFDEDLGMFLEDLDLGWRAQRAGWRAYYVPEAVGFHTRGATAKTRRPRWSWLRRYYLPWLRPELQARYILNRYRLMARYDSMWSLLRDAPWILWYELRLWSWLVCFERKTLRLVVGALIGAARARRGIIRPIRLAGS